MSLTVYTTLTILEMCNSLSGTHLLAPSTPLAMRYYSLISDWGCPVLVGNLAPTLPTADADMDAETVKVMVLYHLNQTLSYNASFRTAYKDLNHICTDLAPTWQNHHPYYNSVSGVTAGNSYYSDIPTWASNTSSMGGPAPAIGYNNYNHDMFDLSNFANQQSHTAGTAAHLPQSANNNAASSRCHNHHNHNNNMTASTSTALQNDKNISQVFQSVVQIGNLASTFLLSTLDNNATANSENQVSNDNRDYQELKEAAAMDQ